MAVFLLLLVSSFAVTMIDSYKHCTHGPHAKDPTLGYLNLTDGYSVTWSHATNSPAKLTEALASNINMIEADVQMRHNQTDTEPIMAHPPDTDSNLTLADFVNQVTGSSKGMKLDFKTIMAVEPSLKLLKNVSETKKVENPIWLNADILDGPCYDKVCTPVDSKEFVKLCEQYFPAAVLSIGWTTGNDMKPEKTFYTWNQVIKMGKVVYDTSQPITYPVRAALIKRSMDQLRWLLDLSRNFTLTVWSSDTDEVAAKDLVELRTTVYDQKNIYYDLPKEQAKAFAKALEGVTVNPNNPYNSNSIKVKTYAKKSCTDVMVGETKVLFTGKGGWVSSVSELKPSGMATQHVTVEVFFLSLDAQNPSQNITVVVGSDSLSGANGSSPVNHGVVMTLKRSGKFTVTSPDGPSVSNEVTDPKLQYRVSFWFPPSMNYVHFSVSSKADYRKEKFIRYEGSYKPSKQFILLGVGEQDGAVLVNEFDTAISLPSGSSSRNVPSNLAIFSVLALLMGLFLFV